MIALPATVIDSSTGAVSATFTIDDNTASVKDDTATLAAVINQMLAAMRSYEKRISELEATR